MTGTDASLKIGCAIVIVTYNSARDIDDLLDSIPRAAGTVPVRTVVVDNGSCDDTVARVRARSDATCIDAGTNLGYAGAINLGRSVTGERDSLLVLNSDLVLEPGAIESLYTALVGARAGIAVPVLVGVGGSVSPSVRREPSVCRALGDAIFGGHARGRPEWASETVWRGPEYERGGSIAWATGAAWLIADRCDRSVGSWDESYFLYSEEVDYAERARTLGFRLLFVPEARVLHREGGSGSSPRLVSLLALNRVRYFRSRHGRVMSACFRACVMLNELLRSFDRDHRMALVDLIRNDQDDLVRRVRGGAPT